MRKVTRQTPVLVSVMLALLLLPGIAVAQVGGGFGTDAQTVEGEGPQGITVTDVQVAREDGLDRVTFEITGDGLAGWRVQYEDNPRTQGQGAPVELPGDATLGVAITNVLLPPDAPEGVEPFLDDLPGPEGGVITEILNDSIFEGQHAFFIGVSEELPYRVQRLQDPQRVVIHIASDTPVDGVETGVGGAVNAGAPFNTAAVLAIGFAVVLLVSLRIRRRYG